MDHQYLSLHAITTFSGALLNRDENNLPKELVYGGVTRTRVSAQCWRRAERTYMRNRANDGDGPLGPHSFGKRTREWAIATADALVGEHDWNRAKANVMARLALEHCKISFADPSTDPLNTNAMKTKVAIFAPPETGTRLAAILHSPPVSLEEWFDAESERLYHRAAQIEAAEAAKKNKKRSKGKSSKPNSNEQQPAVSSEPTDSDEEESATTPIPTKVRNTLVAALAPVDAVDIALFGRMLAEIAEIGDVDGAIQSMHAFTVDAAEVDDDYFTAVDDRKEDRRTAFDAIDRWSSDDGGAAMTGYQSLTSGTFYRNAVLDRAQLRRNINRFGIPPEEAEELAEAAERAFVEAFVHAVPTAKKNSTGALGNLPKLVLAVSGSRPVNYASAFERPLVANGQPVSIQAVQRLLRQHRFAARRLPGISAGRALTYDLDIHDQLSGGDDAHAHGTDESTHTEPSGADSSKSVTLVNSPMDLIHGTMR